MSNPDGMFDHDIDLYEIGERPGDALTETIRAALREALWEAIGAHPSSHILDRPDGITEIEGEYDLTFIAKVIRARLP